MTGGKSGLRQPFLHSDYGEIFDCLVALSLSPSAKNRTCFVLEPKFLAMRSLNMTLVVYIKSWAYYEMTLSSIKTLSEVLRAKYNQKVGGPWWR